MRTHQGRSGKRLNRRARLRPALHASRNVEGPGCCLAPALLAPGVPPFGTPLVLSLILPGRWSRPRESCMRPTSRSGQVFSPTKSPTTHQASHNNICAKVVRSGEARHARAANSAHPRAEPVLYAPRADPVGKSKQSKDDHFSSPRRQHSPEHLARSAQPALNRCLADYVPPPSPYHRGSPPSPIYNLAAPCAPGAEQQQQATPASTTARLAACVRARHALPSLYPIKALAVLWALRAA